MVRTTDEKREIDLLSLACVFAITAFVSVLVAVASANPNTRSLLGIVIFGLGTGGLILFRQLRKAASSLITNEARALYAATHDTLTQLPNKALFLDRLQHAGRTADGAGLAVLCIRMDRFQDVNEGLGVAAGDEVVAQVASRFAGVIGEHDTLARLSDDLFGLLLVGRAAEAQGIAERLQKVLEPACDTSSGEAFVTASIGIGFDNSEPMGALEALRLAQLALSHAVKLGGGHASVFAPDMDLALKARKTLEVDLRHAFADEAMSMVYQPQVDDKGAVVGVEALMRWSNRAGESIPPSTFVPLAEGCGLGEILGTYALERAFRDAQRWPGITVAVNVSAIQIRGGGLIETLKRLLETTGANPRNLELEITEGVLLHEEAGTYQTLSEIRKLGFTLSLDDFGTGYSSLSYLRRFPVDKIKIDRSFVAQLGKQPESSAIVKAIVEMAVALDLKVIAEGVESQAQVERLTLAGCTAFQGYLFSRPVDPAVIDEIIAGRLKLAA